MSRSHSAAFSLTVLAFLPSRAAVAPAQSPAFLVEDINVGGNADPWLFAIDGDTIYFSADDGLSGRELWRSDGTAVGTRRVRDIWPGSQSGVSYGRGLVWNGVLYFGANGGGGAGTELCRSDGTETGTWRVKDIRLGAKSSLPQSFTEFGGALFFTIQGGELWRTTGTEAGTARVANLVGVYDLLELNGVLLWATYANYDCVDEAYCDYTTTLWRSDGTGPGTTSIATFEEHVKLDQGYPPLFPKTTSNGLNYFRVLLDDRGSELWRTDGTALGTTLLMTSPTSAGSGTQDGLGQPIDANGTFFFRARDGAESNLWRSDGTAAGTFPVTDFPTGRVPAEYYEMVAVGGSVFFLVYEYILYDPIHIELWRSDGTPEGTFPVDIDLDPVPNGSSIPQLGGIAVDPEKLLLVVCQTSGCMPWVTTASYPGLVPVPFDGLIRGSGLDGFPDLFGASGDLVFLAAREAASGHELWALPTTALSFCGDGAVDPGRGEQCDDGNLEPDDGCSVTCIPEPSATALAACALAATLLLRATRRH